MFEKQFPIIHKSTDIESQSLAHVREMAMQYPRFQELNEKEQTVAVRMIHATTCFDQILEHIYFTDHAIAKISGLLQDRATLIVDTGMICAGLSAQFTKRYGNAPTCLINAPETRELAEKEITTRSYAAVQLALKEAGEKPVVLVCGNAPTFLYGAINWILDNPRPLENLAIIAMPVGFVNVGESKDYAFGFMNEMQVEGMGLEGLYGGSTLCVSALHAIYRMMDG